LVAAEVMADISGRQHERAGHAPATRILLDEEVGNIENSTTKIRIVSPAVKEVTDDPAIEFPDETGKSGIFTKAVPEISFRRKKLWVRRFAERMQIVIKLSGESSYRRGVLRYGGSDGQGHRRNSMRGLFD
jgi:hypothetical protein